MKKATRLGVVEVTELSEAMQPYLQGRKPEIQGAVLADLLSIFLAGHLLVNKESGEVDRAATDLIRESLLAQHIEGVREMLVANEPMILQRLKERAS